MITSFSKFPSLPVLVVISSFLPHHTSLFCVYAPSFDYLFPFLRRKRIFSSPRPPSWARDCPRAAFFSVFSSSFFFCFLIQRFVMIFPCPAQMRTRFSLPISFLLPPATTGSFFCIFFSVPPTVFSSALGPTLSHQFQPFFHLWRQFRPFSFTAPGFCRFSYYPCPRPPSPPFFPRLRIHTFAVTLDHPVNFQLSF